VFIILRCHKYILTTCDRISSTFAPSVAAAQAGDFANFPNKIEIITENFENVEKAKS
jgi:hypothetical protein